MKAVFLCGGSGKRMFPITEDKFLLDFLGKPLLEHQLETAREAGLTHFVIIGNPENIGKIEQITKRFPGIKVDLALQKEPLGIADALKSAQPFLQGQLLVINPNDVFSSSACTKSSPKPKSRRLFLHGGLSSGEILPRRLSGGQFSKRTTAHRGEARSR
jgi:dTDP-glucose pyrophosphorylase